MIDCVAIADMSQCSLDEKVEVTWDHDSPTPAVWKRLQGEVPYYNNLSSEGVKVVTDTEVEVAELEVMP